jgi:hypothetical protein
VRDLCAVSRTIVNAAVLVTCITPLVAQQAQQAQPEFGGSYSTLDAHRQRYVQDWVARFNETTGQATEPAAFYDNIVRISTKTTFEAITHALMTTSLTDASGKELGDALGLIEQIDGVRGKLLGEPGDRQFRMYVRLTEAAVDTLDRSQQFDRRGDNTVFHKGYPINYRGRGGPPSIQMSIALDRRHADIDVDYRSSMFPVSLFNGHLAASNSDIRAGNNYDRHTDQWVGLQNWWRNFFGIHLTSDDERQPADTNAVGAPRIGNKPAAAMTEDFLKAWLVDGDIRAALSYVSRQAFACLSEDEEDPASFDRGMAPLLLARRLKAAYVALPPVKSLEDRVVGVRLNTPGLRAVTQPRHAQFVIYSVPDDVARAFQCDTRHAVNRQESVGRTYGKYFGASFYIKGRQSPTTVALLWEREGEYLKIVSWQTDTDGEAEAPEADTPRVAAPILITADPSLVQATHRFFEDWLVRKDYDTAFGYISTKAYACYNLTRDVDQPATSLGDAGKKVRDALQRTGKEIGKIRSIDDVLMSVPPVHSAIRVMDHRYASTFTLASVPDALADSADCEKRARGEPLVGQGAPRYGNSFGVIVRFRSDGEPPVLRLLWSKEDGTWRISVYDVEVP